VLTETTLRGCEKVEIKMKDLILRMFLRLGFVPLSQVYDVVVRKSSWVSGGPGVLNTTAAQQVADAVLDEIKTRKSC